MASISHRRLRELEALRRPARHSVYVWEWPVRIVHWVIVFALIVLSLTGYYIHHPFLSGAGGPGHPGFTMGLMRFIHEATGFAFIAAVLLRTYWAFVGNRYAHWRALLPITKAQRRDLLDMIRFYALLRSRPPRANGHNPLAAASYLLIYAGFVVTSLTGLGLFAWIIGSPPWTTLFGWTYHVMSEPSLRVVHFLLMFVYLAFAIFHIYCSILIDIEERNGELSSIITGYKANMLEGEMPRDDPRRAEV
jgi:Ni/Fe-hydrogenase 1 B-type cytochrome subunit